MKVGLLALQGTIAPHADAFASLGVDTLEVRTPAQLVEVDAPVVTGGESTTISKLLVSSGLDDPFLAVVTRAPFVEAAGPNTEVLARVDGHPVLCRQGSILVSAFHPELTADSRLHHLFLTTSNEEDSCPDTPNGPPSSTRRVPPMPSGPRSSPN